MTAEFAAGARRPLWWAVLAGALLLAGWDVAAPWVETVAGLVE